MRGARFRAVITSSALTAVCRRAADRPPVAGVRAPAPHEKKKKKKKKDLVLAAGVSDPELEFNQVSGSVFGIRIQEGKNNPQK